MWLRIKQLAIPISLKLTIFYAAILFCTLLLTSLLAVTGVYYVLYTQADEDIALSTNSLMHYLAAGNPLDQNLLKENLLIPGVILRIFDDQNNLLIDSAPYFPGNHALSKEYDEDIPYYNFMPLKIKALRIVDIDDVYFYDTNQMIWQNNQLYQLHIMKTISEQTHFLNTLIQSLLITSLIGLLIAVTSGIFLSRKILHPIRDITDTAKKIGISDLGKRINVTNSNDELQELAKTFNHMLNRIQTGFEQQRRFVSDASHELRTPITVISGYADMLDRWGKQDPAVLAEAIEAIKSEATNMYNLIEKLLFLARDEQGKEITNKFLLNMKKLIEEIVLETKLIAPNHQIILLQNDLAIIQAETCVIKQMIRIFIENSIKYTPVGGTISITSRSTNNYLEIIIEDTGIGIPVEDQPKIFDRFYRVDKSRSKSTGGMGLGLSIASLIAEQHNITIQLNSTYGQGTTITVKIPLASS